MTIMEYREQTTLAEQKEFAKKLQCWLGAYTQECFEKVMNNIETIINDEFTLKLIDELYNRRMKEIEEEVRTIEFGLGYGDFGTIHNHPLEHSNSYRDVLYDMYIRG